MDEYLDQSRANRLSMMAELDDWITKANAESPGEETMPTPRAIRRTGL